ncbi:MAG: peroxiredoxin [Myxococcota bacterium]
MGALRPCFVLLLGVGLLASLGCRDVRRPDGQTGLLPVGAEAPDVVGEGPSGETVRLSDVRGQVAAVYFYPKDGTPGCTKQACAFRDAYDRLEDAGVVVFGVSGDSVESHREFRKEHALPFPLVADESGEVARAYGVPTTLGMASRTTFLVGPDGRVVRVWPDVDPAVDADRVLAAAGELKSDRASE